MPKKGAQKKNKAPKEQRRQPTPPNTQLKGWTAIAKFLAIPVSTAHRWAKDGMPVGREGRFTVANQDELRAWLGRESHMDAPAQILTDEADVAGALKQSIAAAKRSRKQP